MVREVLEAQTRLSWQGTSRRIQDVTPSDAGEHIETEMNGRVHGNAKWDAWKRGSEG